MKKSVFLAIIGAAALTGCQNEVMKQREYVPAPREDAEAITAPAPAFSDRSGAQTTPETAPETAPKDAPATAPEKRGGAAAQEFPPISNSEGTTKLRYPALGKTGTTNDYRNVAFMGALPTYVNVRRQWHREPHL